MKVFLLYAFLFFRIKESWSWSFPAGIKLRSRGWTITTTTSSSSSSRFSSPMDNDDWDPSIQDFDGNNNEDDGRPTDEELEAMLGNWDERVARFNTVHLVGRVGNAPEPRYFDDGKVVVNLSLACRRKYHYLERQVLDLKSGDEETDWYGLEIWGQTAEFVSKYVDKGARVGVIGTFNIDEWDDKETGEKRCKGKVVVREFDILESKAEADLRRGNQRGPSFYTGDNNDDDEYNPASGTSGGFFD